MRQEPRGLPHQSDDVLGGPNDDVDDVVGDIVAHGIERISDMAVAMLAALREEMPTYGRGWSPSSADDVLTSVRRAASMLLESIRDDRPPLRQDLISVTLVAVQRARDGVSRREMSEAMALCRRVGFTFLLREAPTIGTVRADVALTAAAVIAERLDDHVRSIEQAVDEGYAEAEGDPSTTGRPRSEAVVANRLLDGRWCEETEVRLNAERSGSPLGRFHAVVMLVGTSKSTDIPLGKAAAALADALKVSCLLEGTRWGPVPHVPAVVSVRSAEAWHELTCEDGDGRLHRVAVAHGLVAVVTPCVDDLAALPGLYRGMPQNLRYLAAARNHPGVLTSRRLELFALIAGDGRDLGRLSRFIRQMFEPIEQQPNADVLFGVLEAFGRVSGQNRWGDVAIELNVHRNTLMPYVRKIERLTTLSFDSVADVHELLTAYRLREFLYTELDKLDLVEGPHNS